MTVDDLEELDSECSICKVDFDDIYRAANAGADGTVMHIKTLNEFLIESRTHAVEDGTYHDSTLV